MRKGVIDANVSNSVRVLPVMNERPHSPHGKIDLHGNGLGVPSPDTVEKRAREIAMIDERNPDEFSEADWQLAKNELLGVAGSHAPEVDDVFDEALSERDDIPGASGHRMPKNGFDEEPVGEELVSDGIAEAAHDQMLEARREELEEERREK